jgi:fatty-acyl-CoA synthase
MKQNPLYESGRVGDLILSAVQRYDSRIAFQSSTGTTTYRELGAMILSAQASFGEMGLKPGDVVAQLVGNDVRTFAFIAAVYLSGLTTVALQPTLSHDDKVFILNDCDAKLLVTDGQYAPQAESLVEHCPKVVHWRAHGSAAGWSDFWSQPGPFGTRLSCKGCAEDIVRIQYTGGTTGRPKGVMLSNRANLTNAQMVLAGMDWPESPVYLCAMPMTHGAGGMIIPTLFRGGRVVLHRGFDVDGFLSAVEAEGCTMTWLVPTAIYRLLDHPRTRKVDWSAMRAFVYSAAPMSASRVKEALEVVGPCLVQMYGQTEAPNTVLTMTQSDHVGADLVRLSSAGREYPGVQVALLDDECRTVPDGEVGEICVRGPLVMSGYLHQPAQTEAALKGAWLHTGDMARRDADGYFFIVDRKKDMIISGGYNVYPQEIENVLARHPAVLLSAVIGVPDPDWGESVRAYVVLRSGAAADASELIAAVRAAKGSIYAPKSLEFVEQLPLTVYGKIDKKELRARHAANLQQGEVRSA